jgi:hypothetical protein
MGPFIFVAEVNKLFKLCLDEIVRNEIAWKENISHIGDKLHVISRRTSYLRIHFEVL